MRRSPHRPSRDSLLALLLAPPLWIAPPPAHATAAEVEPNDSCAQALSNGAYSAGGTDGEISNADVDFFAFELTPGATIDVDLKGASSDAATLPDPLIGAFDASCAALDSDDDSGYGLDARLQLVVPDDGVIVFAAADASDSGFSGASEEPGTYRLDVSEIEAGGVAGLVTDADTGLPLSTTTPVVVLRECGEYQTDSCGQDVGSVVVPPDGHYQFDTRALEAGRYQVWGYANDYQETASPVFAIDSPSDVVEQDIVLRAMPLSITMVTTCVSPIPPGTTCNLKATMLNRTGGDLDIDTWGAVEAFDTGFKYGYSRYITGKKGGQKPLGLTLPPGSTVVTIPFDLPKNVDPESSGYVDIFVSKPDKPQLTYDMANGLHYYVQQDSRVSVQHSDALAKQLEAEHRSFAERLLYRPARRAGPATDPR